MNDADDYYKTLIAESARRRPRRVKNDPVDHAAAAIGEPVSPPTIENV